MTADNTYKIGRLEQERTLLKRKADLYPSMREGRGGGGWKVFNGSLLSKHQEKLVRVDHTSDKVRVDVPIDVAGMGNHAAKKELARMLVKPEKRSTSPIPARHGQSHSHVRRASKVTHEPSRPKISKYEDIPAYNNIKPAQRPPSYLPTTAGLNGLNGQPRPQHHTPSYSQTPANHAHTHTQPYAYPQSSQPGSSSLAQAHTSSQPMVDVRPRSSFPFLGTGGIGGSRLTAPEHQPYRLMSDASGSGSGDKRAGTSTTTVPTAAAPATATANAASTSTTGLSKRESADRLIANTC